MKHKYKQISLWIFTLFLGCFLLACSAGNTGNGDQAKMLSQIGGQAHSNSLNGVGVELNSFWLLDKTNHYAKVYGKIDGNTITVESMPLQPDNTDIQAYYSPYDIMICRFYKSKWYQLPSGYGIDATVAQPIMLRVGANPSDCSGGESYTLTVKFLPSSQSQIKSYTINGITATPDANNNITIAGLPSGTDLSKLVPDFTLSDGATATVAGVPQISGKSVVDFSDGKSVQYVVTSANGKFSTTYNVTASLIPHINFVSLYTLYPENNLPTVYQNQFDVSTGQINRLDPNAVTYPGYSYTPNSLIYDSDINYLFVIEANANWAHLYRTGMLAYQIQPYKNYTLNFMASYVYKQGQYWYGAPLVSKMVSTPKLSNGNKYLYQIICWGQDSNPHNDNCGIYVYTEDKSGVFVDNPPLERDVRVDQKTDLALGGGGKYLYVTTGNFNTVRMYTIDPSSGDVTPLVVPEIGEPGLENARQIVTAGSYVYVAYQNTKNIGMFSIQDSPRGSLKYLGAIATNKNLPVIDMVASANGKGNYIYVNTGSDITTYTIGANGMLTETASFSVAQTPTGLAVDSNGQYITTVDLWCSNIFRIYSIDAKMGGILTPVSSIDLFNTNSQCGGSNPLTTTVMVDAK